MATPNPDETSSPTESIPMTPALQRIASMASSALGHSIPFSEVMKIALYDEDVGYYSSGVVSIGKGGDFFTSVSTGKCFGTLLALHYETLWRQAGCPDQFLALEQGAHDGQFAVDLIQALRETCPDLADRLLLCLIEPVERFRNLQVKQLKPLLGNRFRHVNSPVELAGLDWIESGVRGIFFSNELLDAFPVHRVVFQESGWSEIRITVRNGIPETVLGEPSSRALSDRLSELPSDLPIGYTTEVNLAASDWVREVAQSGFKGEICIIDYGFIRDEYYARHRSDGTLRRYIQHKMDGDLLKDLGLADLTSHVEFSSLIESAEHAGLKIIELTDQHHFLIELAKPWLREMESKGVTGDTEPRIRQLQTLIHPSTMGSAFKVLRFEAR